MANSTFLCFTLLWQKHNKPWILCIVTPLIRTDTLLDWLLVKLAWKMNYIRINLEMYHLVFSCWTATVNFTGFFCLMLLYFIDIYCGFTFSHRLLWHSPVQPLRSFSTQNLTLEVLAKSRDIKFSCFSRRLLKVHSPIHTYSTLEAETVICSWVHIHSHIYAFIYPAQGHSDTQTCLWQCDKEHKKVCNL